MSSASAPACALAISTSSPRFSTFLNRRSSRTMPNTERNSSGVTGVVMMLFSEAATARSVSSSLARRPISLLTSLEVRKPSTLARTASSASAPTQCLVRPSTELATLAVTTFTSAARAMASSASFSSISSCASTSAMRPALLASCSHSFGRPLVACMRTDSFSSSHRSIMALSAPSNSPGNLAMNSGTYSAANFLVLAEPVLHTPSSARKAPLRSAGPISAGAVISP
mmetsp:Transcript_7490/g.26740  ORF Transcript_7490/g.26740 Transcript_7490/m.26740 type:complete len:227 (-) Transcript_7490:297-977(-)